MSTRGQLAVVNKPNQLYQRMQVAIVNCYSVDDCTQIAEQASGIAAYFKQIRDDESVRKFLAVKLRAWRKIGEILHVVDGSDCESTAAHIRKVRKHFAGDMTIKRMADSVIGNALKLGKLRSDFFEHEVGKHSSVSGMLAAYNRVLHEEWETSPAGQEELKRRKAHYAEFQAQQAKEAEEQGQQRELHAQRIAQQGRDLADLQAAREEALNAVQGEVGFTMDRRDRQHMREVLFLIKAPIHEALRQAAFDQRTTMQAILRAGLAMWFIANGYAVNMDDMHVRFRQPTAPKVKNTVAASAMAVRHKSAKPTRADA